LAVVFSLPKNVLEELSVEPIKVTGVVAGLDENSTWIDGDLEDARKIARASFDVAKQFSEAVIRGDIDQAYALCATEFKASITAEELKEELKDQDEEWEGSPIEYADQGVHVIYIAENSELRSNKNHEWPKKTPKENKRALLTSWWTTERTPEGNNCGRPVEFWISEQEDGYRISKFKPTRA
jgi:hypothetical protein